MKSQIWMTKKIYNDDDDDNDDNKSNSFSKGFETPVMSANFWLLSLDKKHFVQVFLGVKYRNREFVYRTMS